MDKNYGFVRSENTKSQFTPIAYKVVNWLYLRSCFMELKSR
ncbi:hypothetical protein QY97_02792 [Bacillus thermotolerans]|nr:hypothetical protein QY97_02792 [Bacillus thermotolerans]KKB44243.1 hypothetical protein QY96_03265 [Bacillus thermotolerans]